MGLEAGFARSRETGQRADGVRVRHVPVRAPLLGDRVRVPVRRRQRLHRPPVLLPARHDRRRTARQVSRSSRSGCSSSPSPTPRRRSRRARWSAAPASRATSSTASACRASSTRSSATGCGVRAAGSRTAAVRWFNGFGTGGAFFRDFAGSTVVHTVGGMIALAGAIALGPRLGRTFKRDGGGPMPAHDLDLGRHRRRDPVVRLVRLQPRLDAVGHGLGGHRPGRRPTPRSRPAPAA